MTMMIVRTAGMSGGTLTTRTTMADARSTAGSARFLVSVAAVATTIGGSLAMAVHDGRPEPISALEAPSLAPIPTLEPTSEAPPPVRRPVPIATTRSSR
jgi:hypothetical protein